MLNCSPRPGPRLTQRPPFLLLPAERMGSKALSWTVGAKWVTRRVKLMSGMGWQSPGPAGFWHSLGQVKKSFLQQNQAVWCCYSVTSLWKPFAWLTAPKLCFLFSLVLLWSATTSFILIYGLIYYGFCLSYTEMLFFFSWVKYNCACAHTLSVCSAWPLHLSNATPGSVYRRLNIGLSVLAFPWKIFFLQHMEIKHTEQY